MRRCVRCDTGTTFYASMPRCNVCIDCIRAAQTARNHKRMARERQTREFAKAAIAGKIAA